MKSRIKQLLFFILIALLAPPASAGSLDDILALETAPQGVVIETLEADEYDLIDLLPKIKSAAEKLRARFPGLAIALVSHGREQFALTKQNREKHKVSHKGIQQLVADNVEVHVCGTHAGWYDIDPEDYPD